MVSGGFGGGMSLGAFASPPGASSPSFGAPPPPMSFGAAAPQSLFGARQSQSLKAAAPQSRGFFGTSSQSCAAPRSESFRGFACGNVGISGMPLGPYDPDGFCAFAGDELLGCCPYVAI